MGSEVAGRRIELVGRLTTACIAEIEHHDPAAMIPWSAIPTVAAMTAHLGGVHRWVTEVIRTRRAAAEDDLRHLTPEMMRAWFEEGRAALLHTLETVPPATPCWIIGNRGGTVAFWQRRMVFEHVKHLIDLRAAGGGTWLAAPELEPDDYADGIDELLTEFLPRSRPNLPLLPGTIVLHAADSAYSWQINPDWTTRSDADPSGEPVEITARTSDLALMLWERADLLEPDARVGIDGSRATVAALQSAPVHPW